MRLSRTNKQAADAEPATTVIDQKDFRFIPETVAIRAGDSVKFTNSDPQLHNVRTSDGSSTAKTKPFASSSPGCWRAAMC